MILRRSRVGMGWGLKLVCVDCKAVLKEQFLGFPGVYTGRMGFWKFQDKVWKMHEKGVNNGVSQQWGDILNIWSNGLLEKSCSIPCDNRNHSGWAILVSWVQPFNLVQWSDNKCQWFPGRSSEFVSLMTAGTDLWWRLDWQKCWMKLGCGVEKIVYLGWDGGCLEIAKSCREIVMTRNTHVTLLTNPG